MQKVQTCVIANHDEEEESEGEEGKTNEDASPPHLSWKPHISEKATMCIQQTSVRLSCNIYKNTVTALSK